MLSSLLSLLSVIVSLGTVSGVVLHDTRLDKAATVALATPVMPAQYEVAKPFASDVHTHVERSTLSRVVHVYQSVTPGIQPRHERRHLLQKHVPRGHHAFDNYNLPLI